MKTETILQHAGFRLSVFTPVMENEMDNKTETTVLHADIFVGICRRDEIGIAKKSSGILPQ